MTVLLATGVDCAARNDKFAITSLQAVEVNGPLTKWKAIHTSAVTGVGYEEMPYLVLDYLKQYDDTGNKLALALDATGAGGPTAERLALTFTASKQPFKKRVLFKGTIISGGAQDHKTAVPYLVTVARDALLADCLMALRTGDIDMTQLPQDERDAIKEEMRTLIIKKMPSGRERVDHQAGQHDDMMFALALAYWIGMRLAGRMAQIENPVAIDDRRSDWPSWLLANAGRAAAQDAALRSTMPDYGDLGGHPDYEHQQRG